MSKRIYQRLYSSNAPVYQLKLQAYSQRRRLIDELCEITKRNYDADIFLPPESQANEDPWKKINTGILSMKSVMPTKDSKVYFTQGCTINRRKFTEKFHTVRNIDNADILVIPDSDSKFKYFIYVEKIAMFVKHDPYSELTPEEYIWFKPEELINDTVQIKANPSVGDSLMDYLNNNVPLHKYFIMDIRTQDELAKYKCCFFGNAVFYQNRKDWRIEARDHLDKFIVTESSLLNLFKNEYTGFTKEKIDGIINNINSPDIETRKYGLRTLASLDYNDHPYLLWYIVHENDIKIKQCGVLPRDVKYMIKSIESYSSSTERNPSKSELILLKDYIVNKFTNHLNAEIAILKRDYGCDINDILDIKMTPKEIGIDDSLD